MREKLLEKRMKQPLTEGVRKNIEKRLKQLRKDMADTGEVSYCWNEEKDILFATTVNLKWLVAFQNKKVVVWVDVPFLAIPFVQPYKEHAINVIKEEIKVLIK